MSTNPIVEAIRSGQAPRMAKLAAARGMLPLGPEETLEVLATLGGDEDDEIRSSAVDSLGGFNSAKLLPIVENPELAGPVLGFLASWKGLPRDLFQPVIFHTGTPDDALVSLAATSESGEILELISLKQQSLIRQPAIIDALLANPRRTAEADRRAREVKQEFFEKEYGAQIVADEQRARAEDAAVAVEEPEEVGTFYDDLTQFIESDLVDVGDALFAQFEAEFGPVEEMAGIVGDLIDVEALLSQDGFLEELAIDSVDAPERLSVLARIAKMSVKERIRFALKGTREVRMLLIRDPNRPVCAAVIQNPRITDAEVEAAANLKGINEEVLRLIAANRAWTKRYPVILNLVKNPKTPVPTAIGLMNRIQTKDLRDLARSRNVPEAVRQMAGRAYMKRQSG